MTQTKLRPETRAHRVLISGSTGLIGRQLVAARRAAGDIVVPLVRRAGEPGTIAWDPVRGTLDPAVVSGFDAVFHLAGEPVVGLRWTAEKKRRILESRVQGTSILAKALAAADRPPKVFLCASGINVYGDRGEMVVDETAPIGKGFLPKVCAAWEAATLPLAGVCRVVNLRIGVVLSTDGGMLAAMLPLFRMGLGGSIAGGRDYVSWVTMQDLIRACDYLLQAEDVRGPVNLVSPEPVTGRAFAAALGAAVGKPAILSVPGWLARLALGEMAEETVLSSVRATPRRLLEDGFAFQQVTIASALAACGVGGTSRS